MQRVISLQQYILIMYWFVGVLVLTLGLATGGNCVLNEHELVKTFKSEFLNYHASGIPSNSLTDILSKYALPDDVRFTNWHLGPLLAKRPIYCTYCRLATVTILDAHAAGSTKEEIGQLLIDLCESLNLSTNRVCEGTVIANLDVLEYVLDNTPNLTSSRMCAMLLQADDCGQDDPSLDWSIDLGSTPKPIIEQHDSSMVKADPFTVVQVTDIHYDPNYLVGGNADCGEPMCCRADQGEPEYLNTTAGRWGDYRLCDIPWEVVTDGLAHIKATHQDIDYVYMTGDLIDHGVWDTSFTKNNATFIKVMTELKNTFGDIPVFPCLGNHEPHPLNVYAPVSLTDENISTAWLYETMADLWSAWLPSEARETILKGGFYTALVRPGFRVVALNNMQCYVYNWFLYNSHTDPDEQLQWLVGVLQAAETAGEKVHMLYHIPTGSSDCYKVWSREYNRIINRFENTVTGQFNGHTHLDEFHIYYDNDEPQRPINVAFTAGSLTSYADVNANYRVYSVDGDDFTVLDHETWIYNMTEANLSPADKLNWYKMYSFKEAYGVTSLTPAALHGLAQRMATDDSLLQKYFEYYNLQGDPKMEEGCDRECLDKLLCGIVTTDSSHTTQCDAILGNKRRPWKILGDLVFG